MLLKAELRLSTSIATSSVFVSFLPVIEIAETVLLFGLLLFLPSIISNTELSNKSIEETPVYNTVKSLDVNHQKIYEETLTKLASGDMTGLTIHKSVDNLWSADIKGFGKGRGSARLFYTDKDGIIDIIRISLDHKF